MQGIYYKTIFRNQKTGETEFDIIPDTPSDLLDNGVVHCKGIIGIYNENTPIEVTGNANGKYFSVDKCFIPYKTTENVKHILRHVSKEMTDNQIEKIAKESKGDLFHFIGSDYGLIYTARVLQRQTTDAYVVNIVRKINKIGLQEELVQELLRYHVPIDKIEALNRKQFTLSTLDKDPYTIFLKYEIDIDIADKFAQRTNTEANNIKRLCGFLLDALYILKKNGNAYTTIDMIVKTMNQRLKQCGVYQNQVNSGIVNTCIIHLERYVGYRQVGTEIYVYLNSVWEEECNIVNHIFRLNNNKKHYEECKSIQEIEAIFNISYNDEQKNAFQAVRSSGVKILTGPPGSGKTAVIRGLIESFGNNGVVKLAATTGMAAKVMKDACQHGTETANMMLNVIPFNDTVKGKDLNDPVNADLIIVDEISMIGMQLFSVLVQAVKSGSILLLVGDEDQLQSVDYGNVLHDLIASSCIEVYRLKTVMRSSGLICANAQKVNQGNQALIQDKSFQVLHLDSEEALMDYIRGININRCQILTPMRKKGICTKSLNKLFVKKNNPFVLAYGQREFHLNDRIIMTKTNYHKGYVNGDIGHVIGVDEDERMMVKILNKTIILDREELQNVDFAYAITIHKSQGSEFKEICIVLPSEAQNMMTRRLLYTAITRAKEKVVILEVGSQNGEALAQAINNTKEQERKTLLAQRIKDRFV